MYIRRVGSQRIHGWKEVLSTELNDDLESGANNLHVTVENVTDPSNPNSHHDYTIFFSPQDIAAIIRVASRDLWCQDSRLLNDALKDSHSDLQRLLMAALGYLPPE